MIIVKKGTMMKQNIIPILMISVRADYGGGPEHMFRLCTVLSNHFRVYVACPKETPYWERFALLIGQDRMIEIPHRRFSLSYLFHLMGFMLASGILIIHSHGKGAGIYGRLLSLFLNRPCVHTFHGIHIDHYNRLFRLLYTNLERFLSSFTARLIAVSHGEYAVIGKLRLCNPQKLVVIENGVDIPTQIIDGKALFAEEKLIVLTMSRFNYQKNSELLIPIIKQIEARRGLNRFQFVILGSGESQERLQVEVNKLGLDAFVIFQGAVDNPQDFIKSSFCYLSTSRWEGLPLSVIEAMSFGLPVIATDVVGNNDLIEHGRDGFLYGLTNPKDAATYLLQLADDFVLWQKLSIAAKDKVIHRFSIEKMASKIETEYMKLT